MPNAIQDRFAILMKAVHQKSFIVLAEYPSRPAAEAHLAQLLAYERDTPESERPLFRIQPGSKRKVGRGRTTDGTCARPVSVRHL